MMTVQQAFNQAFDWFVMQNKPLAQSSNGECGYRLLLNDETHACAVGIFIPNEVYHPDMDIVEGIEASTSVTYLLERFPEVYDTLGIEGNREEVVNFLAKLQEAHDGASNTKESKYFYFSQVGDSLGLEVPSIT